MSSVSNNNNIAVKWSQFASIAKNEMLAKDQKVYFTGKSKSGLCCNVAGEARTFSNPQTLAADSKLMRENFLALATKKLGGAGGVNAEVIRDIEKKLIGTGKKNSAEILATPLDKRVISEVVKQVSDITKKGVYNTVRNETTGKLERVDAQIGTVNKSAIKKFTTQYKKDVEARKTMADVEAAWDRKNAQTNDGKIVYSHEATVKRCHDFVCAPEFKKYRQAALELKDDYDIVYDLVEYAKDDKVSGTDAVIGNEGAPKPPRKKAEIINCRCISKVLISDEWNPDGTFTLINAGDAGRHFGTVKDAGFDEAVRRASIPTVGGIFFEEGLIKPNKDGVRLDVCTDKRGLGKMHTTNGVFYKCTATNTDTYNNNKVGVKSKAPKNYNIVDFSMPSLAMNSMANFDILSCASWMDKCYNLRQKVEEYSPDVQDKLKLTPKQIADFKQILTEVRDKTCYIQKGKKRVYPKTHIEELDKPSVLASSTTKGLPIPKRANDLMLMAIFGGDKFRTLLNLFDGKTKGKADALINLAKKADTKEYKEALLEAVENYKATLKETLTKFYDGLIKKGIKKISMPPIGCGFYQNYTGIVADVISDVAAEKSDKIQTQVINRQSQEAADYVEDDAKAVYLKNEIDKKIAKLEELDNQKPVLMEAED